MSSKYIIYQDADGFIRVGRHGLFGIKLNVRDRTGNKLGVFNTEAHAEATIEALEKRKIEDARAKKAAIDQSGVRYVFDCSNDEDLTIKNRFRIMRTDRVEDKPFYIQELTSRGWVTIVDKFEKFVIPKAKRFSSEAFAKTELLAIVQKLQDVADRRKRARVLKVIDSKVYDHTGDNQLAGSA